MPRPVEPIPALPKPFALWPIATELSILLWLLASFGLMCVLEYHKQLSAIYSELDAPIDDIAARLRYRRRPDPYRCQTLYERQQEQPMLFAIWTLDHMKEVTVWILGMQTYVVFIVGRFTYVGILVLQEWALQDRFRATLSALLLCIWVVPLWLICHRAFSRPIHCTRLAIRANALVEQRLEDTAGYHSDSDRHDHDDNEKSNSAEKRPWQSLGTELSNLRARKREERSRRSLIGLW